MGCKCKNPKLWFLPAAGLVDRDGTALRAPAEVVYYEAGAPIPVPLPIPDPERFEHDA